MFPNPHISHPYNKIGFTSFSNNSNCKSIGKCKFLALARRLYAAFVPCSAICFLVAKNELFFLNNIPRYLYSGTVSKAILSKVNVCFVS